MAAEELGGGHALLAFGLDFEEFDAGAGAADEETIAFDCECGSGESGDAGGGG